MIASFANDTFKIWQPDLASSKAYSSTNKITSMSQLNDLTVLIGECSANRQLGSLKLVNSASFQTVSSQQTLKNYSCVNAIKSFQQRSFQYVAVSNGSRIEILNVTGNSLLSNNQSLSYHNKSVTCLDYNSNSSLLATGSDDFSIGLWNMATYKIVNTSYGHIDQIYVVSLISNGNLLATGAREPSIRIWNKTNLNLIANLTNTNTLGVKSIVSLGNGLFASAGYPSLVLGSMLNFFYHKVVNLKLIKFL